MPPILIINMFLDENIIMKNRALLYVEQHSYVLGPILIKL